MIAGRKYWPDGTPVAGQQFEYGFDDIGNRTVARRGGDENGWNLRESLYTPNLLNQYSNRTVPGFADVVGVALATKPVYVNGQMASRKGEYFRRELSVNNAGGPVWLGVTVTSPGEPTVTGNLFVPRTPEVFTYDLDGNMASDGRWTYTWDAENRLVQAQSRSDVPSLARRKVEWQYDAFGRRIRQTTWNWLVQSNLWVVTEDLKLVSDPLLYGRHVVDLNASNNVPVRTYVWGLDLSETMDGAGGVGGLLWVTLHTASGSAAGTHFCAYDGNGNIVALSAASDGSATARYEYGPFAEPIRLTGPTAALNPFRFSTKRTCNTTDQVLYEYRVYQPSTGRWPNRDPIGELSFHVTGKFDPHGPRARTKDWNQYGFVQNDPIDAIDYLGLFCCKGVWYNPFTHCCRNGKVTKRGKVDTGYSKCSAPTQTQPKVDHVWLEWDGGSAGFYPNGATDGTLPGQVQSPDPASQRAGKKCNPIRLDPCHYDIDAFKNCMQQYINRTSANPPIYHTFQIFGENCQTWSADGVAGCTYDAWYDKHMQGI